MIENNISNSIQIRARLDSNIKSGDVISIQVVKQLTNNKWAVSYKGILYPASSMLNLVPDTLLKVKVFRQANLLTFKIIDETPVSGIKEIIQKIGITDNQISRSIIASLMRNQMPVSSQMIERFKEILKKYPEKQDDNSFNRMAAHLLNKGISPDRVESLVSLLDFGSNSGDKQDSNPDHHGSRKEEEPFTGENVKKRFTEIIEGVDSVDQNLLQLFNHFKSEKNTWVIIPFTFGAGENSLKGTFRVLLDNYEKQIIKASVIVFGKHRWSFFLNPQKKVIQMMVFCSAGGYNKSNGEHFKKLISKLESIGIKVDNTVHDDKYFDGFSPIFTDPVQPVNDLIV